MGFNRLKILHLLTIHLFNSFNLLKGSDFTHLTTKLCYICLAFGVTC